MTYAVWMHITSLVGAALVLAGFGGQQFAGLKADGMAYAVLNFSGSMLLASTAISPLNAGVLLVETSWMLLSFHLVIRAARRRTSAG